MLTLLAIVYAITCVLLVIFVLLQAGKAGNMGLFGGGGTSSIGSSSGDIMTRITTVLGVVFFAVALSFAFLVSRDNTASRHHQAELQGSAGMLAPGEKAEVGQPAAGQEEARPGADGMPADIQP